MDTVLMNAVEMDRQCKDNRKPIRLKIDGLKKSYQDHTILKDINLTFHKGEFIVIIGKSGCGKSTLLRLIAGLEQPTGGTILQKETPLTGINVSARMMFQNGRFLPWKKVLNNIGIGLRGDWKPKAKEALAAVGLFGYENKYPLTLSGGQKQRIALARALIHQPDLLLLDEPLGALDALTRMEMQNLIENVWKKHGLTCVFVTHDVEEAVRLADRVILIDNGKVKKDLRISLARPRVRTSPEFNRYAETLLNQILNPNA